MSFINENDSTKELMAYINELIDEDTYLIYDKKFTLKEEQEWKERILKLQKKNDGYSLIARIDGKIAGTTTAQRGKFKEKTNVVLGIAIAKQYRSIGLEEALLKFNIQLVRTNFAKICTVWKLSNLQYNEKFSQNFSALEIR